MFLNNRYHDPTLGTFISVDPLVSSTGEPYIYAGGNPATYADPTGLCWFGICDAVEIAVDLTVTLTLPPAGELIDSAVPDYSDVQAPLADAAVELLRDGVKTTADRATTGFAYLAESSRRRASNPVQTYLDWLSGTAILEDVSAIEAILVEDGELMHDNEYCGSSMTCITGVLTGHKATTTGHTVRFAESDPSLIEPWLRAHEMQHVYDTESLGGVPFLNMYFTEWAIRMTTPIDGGYKQLWTEQRAYQINKTSYSNGVRPSRSGPVCTRSGPC